jgi:voltage-gated potassium channel
MTVVLIMGAAMYVIEGTAHGFTSIPRSMYWAIVTITTVGYGDIAPQTALGQTVAAITTLLGYSLIIIPTGIFSVELVQQSQRAVTTQSCPSCTREGHDHDAIHCKYCGSPLD